MFVRARKMYILLRYLFVHITWIHLLVTLCNNLWRYFSDSPTYGKNENNANQSILIHGTMQDRCNPNTKILLYAILQ